MTPTCYAALFVAFLGSAPVAGQAPDSSKSAKPDLGPMRTIEFDVDQGTWLSLDVSPDGQTILFDLLGDLYTLPAAGGDAKLLLSGRDWDHMPRFSPDGKRIAFVSDRDGNMNVWIANVDGTALKQITKERTDKMRSPTWSRDGLYVIAHKAAREGGFFMYHRDGGTGVRIGTANGAGPTLTPDSRFLYYSNNGINRLDRLTGDTIRLTHGMGGGVRPQVSPDGRYLAYGRLHDARTSLHLRDLRTGAERVLAQRITPRASGNQDELPGYAFTPDGRNIVLTIDGKLHRIDVATGADQLIPFRAHVSQQVAQLVTAERRVEDGELQARVVRWPSLSPDGRKLVFSALGKLYTTEVGAQPLMAGNGSSGPAVKAAAPTNAKRLTTSEDREYTPAFSPDGKWIAYTTWSDRELGQLRLISADGNQQRTLTTIPGRYTNPSWSQDGSKIAFVRGSGVELRGGLSDDEPYLDLVWVPLAGGEPSYITSARYTFGFAMRYYPVITFSPDGTRVYFTERGTPLPSGDQRTALASVRLDGSDKRVHMRFVPVEEVIPSPDARHVAFARRENIVVAAMPDYTTTPIELSFESGAVPVKKLTREGGNFVQWKDSNTLQWGFVNRYYRQRLDQDAPEVIAEVSLSAPREQPSGSIAFTNARIVTMKGTETIENGTIVVRNNRIEAIGPANRVRPPAGAKVVDVRGKTIIPGLIDVHAHMHYASMEFHPQHKWEYIAQLAYGVTTTFDPSAHNLDVFSQYEMVETGEMIGPRIYSTGDVIYGDERVFPVVYEPITSIAEARNVVKRFKAYDPIMLKEYMQPRRDQRQWLAQAARENGVPITAEGGADLVMDLTMVLDGYTAWEHALPIELHDDVVQLVAKSGTHYTPTLVVGYGGPTVEAYFWNKGDYHDDAKLRRFVPESEVDAWRRYQHVPDDEWHFLTISKGAAAIHKAGGKVSLGAHGQLQGLGTLWELWGLGMGGISNFAAMQQATTIPADKLGLSRDIGSLEVGKLADFVVLDANPLDDLKHLAAAKFVVKNGLVWDAATMTRVYPDFKPLPKFFWMPDEDVKRFGAPAPRPIR